MSDACFVDAEPLPAGSDWNWPQACPGAIPCLSWGHPRFRFMNHSRPHTGSLPSVRWAKVINDLAFSHTNKLNPKEIRCFFRNLNTAFAGRVIRRWLPHALAALYDSCICAQLHGSSRRLMSRGGDRMATSGFRRGGDTNRYPVTCLMAASMASFSISCGGFSMKPLSISDWVVFLAWLMSFWARS